MGISDCSYFGSEKLKKKCLYFQQALLGNNFVSEPIISRTTGIHQVNIAAPIWGVSKLKKGSTLSTKSPKGVFIGKRFVDYFVSTNGNNFLAIFFEDTSG